MNAPLTDEERVQREELSSSERSWRSTIEPIYKQGYRRGIGAIALPFPPDPAEIERQCDQAFEQFFLDHRVRTRRKYKKYPFEER